MAGLRSGTLALLVALVVAAPAAASLAVGCGGSPRPASGIRGLVLRGPTRPVCQVGQSCEAPAPGLTLVFSRPGHGSVRTTTGPDGRYRVELAPGTYAVTTSQIPFGRVPSPREVTVGQRGFARVDFHVDTGIR